MANLWFVSDTHFGHSNILTFKRADGSPLRVFDSVQDMDEHMVERWNSVVRSQDHIYHLGDVTMARGGEAQQRPFVALIRRLNGHKRLILGNHDHFPIHAYLEAGFEKIKASNVLNGMLFTHYPVHPNSFFGSLRANVHGHIHASKSPDPVLVVDKKTQQVSWKPYINISVEAINYTPVDMEWLRLEVERHNAKR